jgi:hypothetical protein
MMGVSLRACARTRGCRLTVVQKAIASKRITTLPNGRWSSTKTPPWIFASEADPAPRNDRLVKSLDRRSLLRFRPPTRFWEQRSGCPSPAPGSTAGQCGRDRIGDLRQAEVENLAYALRCDLDVGGFQVAVDDLLRLVRVYRLDPAVVQGALVAEEEAQHDA